MERKAKGLRVFTEKDLEEAGLTELPKGFVNVTERKGKWFFESIDLVSYYEITFIDSDDTVYCIKKKRNARMKDALDETLMLSNK